MCQLQKFYRAREFGPLPPGKDSMKTAIKFLNLAGVRWMEGARSDMRTQLVRCPADHSTMSIYTQREFEHKVIFVYELKMPP
jgi:hypothetical protein